MVLFPIDSRGVLASLDSPLSLSYRGHAILRTMIIPPTAVSTSRVPHALTPILRALESGGGAVVTEGAAGGGGDGVDELAASVGLAVLD